MLEKLKKIFHTQTKETIHIFEENTKINYDPEIFSSLKILSLTDSKLSYLSPLSVFVNLEVLNLSGNKIKDIEPLKDLKKLKIIDLRFNQIERVPLWVFKSNRPIYWERVNDKQEGIFLEGNPLNQKLIDKIKNYPFTERETVAPLVVEKKEKHSSMSIEPKQLIPLNRQRVTIFTPQAFSSDFTYNFKSTPNSELKLNIFTVEYDNNYKIVNQEPLEELEYIVLILHQAECCINPPILELLSEKYRKSKIFLIIEERDNSDIQNKITFFKTYSKSKNIIDVYHSFNQESNKSINEKIYNYLEKTREANSLWKPKWIALRDEIEQSYQSTLDYKTFQSLAKKHSLSPQVEYDIFKYLKRVGSISTPF